jgi:hypothetical protein
MSTIVVDLRVDHAKGNWSQKRKERNRKALSSDVILFQVIEQAFAKTR